MCMLTQGHDLFKGEGGPAAVQVEDTQPQAQRGCGEVKASISSCWKDAHLLEILESMKYENTIRSNSSLILQIQAVPPSGFNRVPTRNSLG